jgi:hypothetical protein
VFGWRVALINGYMDVNELDEMEVYSLLLGFSDLGEEQRRLFLEGLNKYLFVSPTQRRQLCLWWEKACLDRGEHLKQ